VKNKRDVGLHGKRHTRAGVQRTAVKRSIRAFSSQSDKMRLMQEISGKRDLILSLKPHPNVLEYYRCWQQEAHVLVEMELCAGGSMGSQLERQNNYRFSMPVLWSFVFQTACGLAHIHASNVLHLDIKPDNVFLDTEDPARCLYKIGDFGMAVTVAQKVWEDGDGKYAAPELMCDDAVPTPAADIYSLGATLFECATGTPPSRAREHGPLEFSENVSEDLKSLTLWMLELDPKKRPTAQQVADRASLNCQDLVMEMQTEDDEAFQKRSISFSDFDNVNRSPSLDLMSLVPQICPNCGKYCSGECKSLPFLDKMDTS